MELSVDKLVSIVPHNRQIEWQRLEFCAFFHYGINSFTDCEWGTGTEDISIFHPKNLDTDQWCESIKKAGIRACIITAKHHDGFCLWNTGYTDYSVMHTSFKRDIVSELAQSCVKYDLKLGIYLSPWDRHEKTYGQGKAYDDFFCGQLSELMTNYGEIYSVWFDGACGEGENGKKQEYDWERYYKIIRDFQPNAVISISGPDVRWCGNEAGECRQAEWSVVPAKLFSNIKTAEKSQKEDDAVFRQKRLEPDEKDLGSRKVVKKEKKLIWYPAEINVSIRPGWFYHKSEDDKIRSLENLIDIYLNSVGGNGVMLLNIPPHPDGYITRYDAARLEEIGKFISEEFSKNLLNSKASIFASSHQQGFPVENVLKEDESYWKAEDYCEECSIKIEFPCAQTLKWIILQEQIKCSQRIERFEIWADIEGKFEKVYSALTVGYKKICKLGKIHTKKIEIHIKESRKCPTLKFLGIY